MVVEFVSGIALGVALGWILWRAREGIERRELSEARTALQRQLESCEDERMALSGQTLEIQRALRAERSLLDGVAAQAGIAPQVLRRTLARSVLHLEDPYAATYVAEPLQADGRQEGGDADDRDETISRLQAELSRRVAELDSVIGESRMLAGELAETEQNLDATRAALTQLRTEVERLLSIPFAPGTVIDLRERPPLGALAGHGPVRRWSETPPPVASLREEVAALRAKLADRAVQSDLLATRLANQHELETALDHVFDELDRLRAEVAEHRGVRPSLTA